MRPRIAVGFSSQAPAFEDIEAQVTAGVEQGLGELADRLADRFGFLDWSPADEVDDPDAEWIIRLEEEELRFTSEDGESIESWIIWLKHYGRHGGVEIELEQREENRTLYGRGSILPIQDASELVRRIEAKLNEQLHDAFLDNVEAGFLRLIPLGHEVILQEPRVVVPIRQRELRASSETSLGVRLKVDEELLGTIVMKAASRVVDGDLKGCVLGQIVVFEVPPFDDISLPRWWHERFPEAFGSAQTLEVYMHDYDEDLAAGAPTAGGSFLDPEG